MRADFGRRFDELLKQADEALKANNLSAAVAFFASDDASYVTGETLHVTGGLH